MEPHRFGRSLGIGLRVAGRVAQQRLADKKPQPGSEPPSGLPPGNAHATNSSHQTSPPPAAAAPEAVQPAVNAEVLRTQARRAAQAGRGVKQGGRRFASAFLGPLARVSRALALEITGVFFTLFALYFANSAWHVRASAHTGAEHQKFVLSVVVALFFAWFAASSFWRARSRPAKK